MSQVYALFSSEWQSVLSECKIGSATSWSDATLVYADNKVFIPSGQEMFGNTFMDSYYKQENCTQFDYYRLNNTDAYRIKQYTGPSTSSYSTGDNIVYWTRSPYAANGQYFCCVRDTGAVYNRYANMAYFGVSVTFAI